MTRTFLGAALAALALTATAARAADEKMKPFVLASRGAGDPAEVAGQVKAKLAAAGFEVAGSYEPYPGAVVIGATSPALREAAAARRLGAYAAVQRVTVTKVGEETQVAFTNPRYMAAAYRLDADLAAPAKALEAALGRLEEFGPKDGMSAKELRKYHYMMGMEYFDDPSELARFGSQAEAIAAVEAGLAAGKGGATEVWRVDVSPDETVYGVALTEGCSGDARIMGEIDFKPLRSTGHLPYEVIVTRGEVQALYARFRIAMNFPDLSMMGDHSFMKIRCAPGAIENALKKVVGKK
jgi:hypothetical protein